MNELNWNLILVALLNFIAVTFVITSQKADEEKAELPEREAPKLEPTTGQMMLSKWGHIG